MIYSRAENTLRTPCKINPPWWVSNLATPAFFTSLGAALGFLFGEIKEWLQSRRSKKAFFTAIAVEVAALETALEETGQQAEDSLQRLMESGQPPQLGLFWVTTVFDTQLGKLRDVADDLLLQTIETYAVVSRTKVIVAAVNQDSRDYINARAGNESAGAQSRLRSTLRVLGEQTPLAVLKVRALMQKLPDRKRTR